MRSCGMMILVALLALSGVVADSNASSDAAPGEVAAGTGRSERDNSKDEKMPTVAPYRGNCRGAVSLTFDDGWRGQVENTIEIIDPLGIRGTFFLIPLQMENPKVAPNKVTWQRVRELMATGHEMGTHGAVREKLHEADDERLDVLVNESWRLIKEHSGVAPVSYARPGGSKFTDRVVAKVREHHWFLRAESQLPNVKQFHYGNNPRRGKWNDEKTRQQIQEHTGSGGWCIATIHAIVAGYMPFDSKDVFRDHCRWLVSQKETIWTAPMGDVGRYVMTRDAAKLKVLQQGDTSVRFTLASDVEPADVLRVPLTVVIPAPGATEARAATGKDGGEALEATIRDGSILVDVMPDGGETTVTWTVK